MKIVYSIFVVSLAVAVQGSSQGDNDPINRERPSRGPGPRRPKLPTGHSVSPKNDPANVPEEYSEEFWDKNQIDLDLDLLSLQIDDQEHKDDEITKNKQQKNDEPKNFKANSPQNKNDNTSGLNNQIESRSENNSVSSV